MSALHEYPHHAVRVKLVTIPDPHEKNLHYVGFKFYPTKTLYLPNHPQISVDYQNLLKTLTHLRRGDIATLRVVQRIFLNFQVSTLGKHIGLDGVHFGYDIPLTRAISYHKNKNQYYTGAELSNQPLYVIRNTTIADTQFRLHGQPPNQREVPSIVKAQIIKNINPDLNPRHYHSAPVARLVTTHLL